MPSPIPYNSQLDAPVVTPLAWNPNVPTIAQTREAAINAIQQNFAALNAGSAPLAYVPLAGGVSMTGLFNLAGNATGALQPVPYQQLQSYLAANNGVTTYNGRTGAVTGTSADVTTALGFTPANVAGTAFSGNISAPVVSTKIIVPTVYAAAVVGSYTLDQNLGMSQLLNVTGALTITGVNIYPGSVFRVFLYPTTGAIAWPTSVVWPMTGTTAPNLAAGPLKAAVITFTYDSSYTGWILASPSVY